MAVLPRNVRRTLAAWGLCLLLLVAAAAPAVGESAGTAETSGSSSGLIAGEDATLWDIFQKGGWCMWPILGLSVVGLAFFFERLIELRRSKHVPKDFDKDVIHLVDTRGVDAGLAACLDKQSSLSRVLYASLLRYGTTRQEMEMGLQDEGTRLLYDLRRNCRVIGIASNLAPLVGLLGTVLGLINAFDKFAASSSGGKADLGTGVGVALLTTAFGLVVAIPLYAMYHFVKGKAEDLVREIEEKAVDAIITLDRKARRSIRLIEDIEEHLETKEMAAAKEPPNLDAEFDDQDLERSIKTSVTTPAHTPAVHGHGDGGEIDRESVTKFDVTPPSVPGSGAHKAPGSGAHNASGGQPQPPKLINPPGVERKQP